MAQQSGWSLSVQRRGHTGQQRRAACGVTSTGSTLTLPSWQTIPNGGSADVALTYQLPIAGPSNYTLTFGGRSYRLSVDNPR